MEDFTRIVFLVAILFMVMFVIALISSESKLKERLKRAWFCFNNEPEPVKGIVHQNIDAAGAKTIPTKEWTQEQVPDLSTGLEAIDEGNDIGWRLKGRNPDNYGNIGQGSVDLGN